MSFLDKQFLYFLPVAIALWYGARGYYGLRVALLTAASLVFYGYRHWWMILVVLAYALVDWAAGRGLATRRRPWVLALGVGFNLALLCLWKYTPLALGTLTQLIGWPWPDLDLALQDRWVAPLGVSFYAFAGIAYMVDVYRGVVKAEPSPLRYALFTSFFPHLLAGPILRAREFLVHLGPAEVPQMPCAMGEGLFLIGRGYFKKAALGDGIAAAIDPFLAHVGDATTVGVWSLPYLYLYALQIYFDFSGYTDIARGLGLLFGFRWPENFDWPYLATSVRVFWRRWHMTLSRFLRDYLYVPLGGNRRGPGRTALNVMITMLLGGIWHGASWSFMLWGGLHGVFLVANFAWGRTALHRRLDQLTGLWRTGWRLLRILLTFNAVCLAWAFFRLTDLADGLACLRKAFLFDPAEALAGGSGDPAPWFLLTTYGLAAAAAVTAARGKPLPEGLALARGAPFMRGLVWGASLGLFALGILLAPGSRSAPFIYFQF